LEFHHIPYSNRLESTREAHPRSSSKTSRRSVSKACSSSACGARAVRQLRPLSQLGAFSLLRQLGGSSESAASAGCVQSVDARPTSGRRDHAVRIARPRPTDLEGDGLAAAVVPVRVRAAVVDRRRALLVLARAVVHEELHVDVVLVERVLLRQPAPRSTA
jgi:hypothetical protein